MVTNSDRTCLQILCPKTIIKVGESVAVYQGTSSWSKGGNLRKLCGPQVVMASFFCWGIVWGAVGWIYGNCAKNMGVSDLKSWECNSSRSSHATICSQKSVFGRAIHQYLRLGVIWQDQIIPTSLPNPGHFDSKFVANGSRIRSKWGNPPLNIFVTSTFVWNNALRRWILSRVSRFFWRKSNDAKWFWWSSLWSMKWCSFLLRKIVNHTRIPHKNTPTMDPLSSYRLGKTSRVFQRPQSRLKLKRMFPTIRYVDKESTQWLI